MTKKKMTPQEAGSEGGKAGTRKSKVEAALASWQTPKALRNRAKALRKTAQTLLEKADKLSVCSTV